MARANEASAFDEDATHPAYLAHISARREILTRTHPAPVRVLYEYFAGLGSTVTATLDVWPDIDVHAWDIDPRCCKATQDRLTQRGGMLGPQYTILCNDSIKYLTPTEKNSLVALDFNTFTLLQAKTKYKEFMDRIFRAKPRLVLINDCARFKIHLNYKSYGCLTASMDEYLNVWKTYLDTQFGYAVRDVLSLKTADLILAERKDI